MLPLGWSVFPSAYEMGYSAVLCASATVRFLVSWFVRFCPNASVGLRSPLLYWTTEDFIARTLGVRVGGIFMYALLLSGFLTISTHIGLNRS